MPETTDALYFELFNEIGIIEQLTRAMLEARLPDGYIQPHFTVLNHLVRVGEGATPIDLARAFQVPKTSMTHTLARLERDGLIEMRPNPKDGRSKTIWLTGSGRAFRDDTIAALGSDLAWISDKIPPATAESLVRNLSRIRELLDARRDNPSR